MDLRIIRTRLMATGRVIDVENGDMDDGRFFVWLKPEWRFDFGSGPQSAGAFASLPAARAAVRKAQPTQPGGTGW